MATGPQPGLFLSVVRAWATLNRARRLPDVELSAAESASTFFRFFRSKHVSDFRIIGATATLVLLVYIVLILAPFGVLDALIATTKPEFAAIPHSALAARFLEYIKFVLTYIGPAIPIYGAVLAWAYLSASARLGIVDLFACEISTLCRVGSVFDIGRRYMERYDAVPLEEEHTAEEKPTRAPTTFVSQEEYFPVFANNSKDLEQLESAIVNDITAFYTYMKATRDSQRNLAQIKPSPAAKAGPRTSDAGTEAKTQANPEPDPWHDAMANMIYVTFLAFESGRKAIEHLIEYEPTAAENKIVILLTELKCYSFLLGHFRQDQLRYSRLRQREQNYKIEVPELCRAVVLDHGADKDWCTALLTVPELGRRYREAFDELPPFPGQFPSDAQIEEMAWRAS
jgi:hypothetical protein